MAIIQAQETAGASAYPSRWAAMSVLFLASFMNLIDVTIVNVALPSIQSGLAANSTQLEWVVAIYVLAFAAGLLPFGRFGDIFGRKRVFMIGLAGFTFSSALCGLAPGIGFLIAARALQGIAGAMMVPQVLAIVHVIFLPDEKGRVFGLFGAISSLGAVAGPVLGGLLISADLWGLGWRSIFLINLPLGIGALIGAVRSVPDVPSDDRVGVDWGGIALFAATIILLVFPLIEGRNFGWPWWCFALMGASLWLAFLFRRSQKQQAARGHSELLPARLMSNRGFRSGLVLVTFFFSGIPGLFLILAIFFQSGFGMSALQSGLATAPFPVGVMVATAVTGRFGARWPNGRVAAGAAFLAVGMVLLNQVIRVSGGEIDAVRFVAPLLICGLGMGIAIAALFQAVLGSVPARDAGAGSGTLQAFQQVGAVLGIAIVGQIFFATLMASEQPAGPAYIDAAAAATWYPIAVFTGITLCLAWITTRKERIEQ